MLAVYPAVFIEDEEYGGYCVIIPDLHGRVTQGDSIDEAMFMAMDCIAGYLLLLKEEGEEIPMSSAIDQVDVEAVCAELDVESAKRFVTLVSVDVEEHAKKHFKKSVKKTLTIPAWLNEAAKKQGINFSQVLQEALKEKLKVVR